MEEGKYVQVPVELFNECVDALASVKALKALLSDGAYIGKEDVINVCGFDVEKEEEGCITTSAKYAEQI